jgi:hypothetical protein
MQTETKKKTIEDLNQIYSESEKADQELFAEQRSNILLISGDHYTKKNSRFWNRVRDSKDLSSEQKLRLTKNHIQKITKTYVNNIVSHAPWVTILPKNEKELPDTKAAELNKSVWEDAKVKHNLRLKVHQWAKDYIEIGECAVKIFWNPHKGKFLGYEQATDETGQALTDESGQPAPSKTPVFEGEFEFERIFGFNLFRSPSAKAAEDTPFWGIRKMASIDEMKAMVGDDEEKLRWLKEESDRTYHIFDGNSQNYQNSKNQILVKEYYYKPCMEYPQGYYYITVEGGILFEGDLPYGVFPILYCGFDEIQTSPRHRSIVKQLRPYQAEINRAASKIAEHQVTLGDDKLLVQSGTKVTNGGHLPGVRTLQYSGLAPTVLSGRSGEQYASYMNDQIKEMYEVSNVNEDAQLKDAKYDAMGQLFMSLRNKKKFSTYGEKFEMFLQSICETYLTLARYYLPEDCLIAAVGKMEYVNIAEFKTTTPLYYQIKTEPQLDDVNTMMGKFLFNQNILQYVGKQLSREDIGKLIRTSPFANNDESYNDLTLEYDTATNMILALDRGEQPPPNKYDTPTYMIKRLVNRVRQSDFRQLDPQLQNSYQTYIQFYEDLEAQNQQKIMAAQADFIPTGGARVKIDYYVPSQSNPNRVERATLPAESVDWLIKRLADQGSSQEVLTTLNQGAVSEMSGMLDKKQGNELQQGSGPRPPMGQGMTPNRNMQ